MKISTRMRYGLRCLVYLALRSDKEVVRLKKIASSENISERYLEQIASKLKNGGFVSSSRGPHGGYSLARPASKINLKEIYEALEGPLIVVNPDDEERSCDLSEKNILSDVWRELNEHISTFFENKTLEDLVKKYREKNKARMFHI